MTILVISEVERDASHIVGAGAPEECDTHCFYCSGPETD